MKAPHCFWQFSNYLQAQYSAVETAEVKEVALFKNGLGYFVCEIVPPDKQTSFVITPPAAPSHGSFWLSYPEKVELESFVASEKEVEEKVWLEVSRNCLRQISANGCGWCWR